MIETHDEIQEVKQSVNYEQFTLLPNLLFYVPKSDREHESNLLKQIKEYDASIDEYKLIFVLHYINSYSKAGLDRVPFNITMFTQIYNIDDRTRNKDHIKTCVDFLESIQMIDIEPLGNRDKYFMITNRSISGKNFTMIPYDSIQSIVSYSNNKKRSVDKGKLMTLYCYLASRVFNNKKGSTKKAEICYPTYEDIFEDIKLTSDTITKYLGILSEELELIKYISTGTYYNKNDKDKKCQNGNNIYTLVDGDEVNKLLQGLKEYREAFLKRVLTGEPEELLLNPKSPPIEITSENFTEHSYEEYVESTKYYRKDKQIPTKELWQQAVDDKKAKQK